MNNKNKLTIIVLIFTIIVIDISLLFGGNRLSLPIKSLILLVTSIAEFCSIFIMIKVPAPQKYKKEPFGLKAKFYSIVLFFSTILYTIGIWNVTPASPYNIKESILGIGILIQVVFLIYFLLKKISERPDERFYSNLALSASLMFLISTMLLIFIAIYLNIYGTLELKSGYLYIMVGLLLLMFAITYYFFEERR
ncbi:DUF3796 domain-containing protein [Streptococcus uberis]|uniref:DUF3796 domain-containing protein n=1 Tax=Streptococcus uberis TaxID=1349 RepID=UPI0012B552E7|nr:DUF3796 domain-containing protein [Streptococcus uberis]MTC90481.1 DUF3796 domain-containing protein [Streptococcus uberis]MTC95268.1 DUF3796 domain-containing protein [Streptococcus uberis]